MGKWFALVQAMLYQPNELWLIVCCLATKTLMQSRKERS